MNHDASFWIESLQLKKHPEGGYFRETYRSRGQIPQQALPPLFSGPRNFSTAIYYLLPSVDCSKFHRIGSDELWHFYAGSRLTLYLLKDGEMHRKYLGKDLVLGESLQVLIPAHCWFGAKVHDNDSYALAGCTVSPGFDFDDFEFADRQDLLSEYPDHREEIGMLT